MTTSVRSLRVVHVVVGSGFAGTELYVCAVARECAERGHDLVVVGGDPTRMPAALGNRVEWRPGSSVAQAVSSLLTVGRVDVVHAHMTAAESAASTVRWRNRGVFVCTRHFASARGSSPCARAFSPILNSLLDRQIAISEFVARSVEVRPAAVLRHGTRARTARAGAPRRRVLVLQRLEPEKDSATALRAWQRSRLGDAGWSLRIAGEGQQRGELQALAASLGIQGSVDFLGFVDDAAAELHEADILVATAPAEPFGLSVLEAMAAGTAVVAASAGGHVETVGAAEGACLFPPGDDARLAELLVALADDDTGRTAYGLRLQALQRSDFDLDAHVDGLLDLYAT